MKTTNAAAAGTSAGSGADAAGGAGRGYAATPQELLDERLGPGKALHCISFDEGEVWSSVKCLACGLHLKLEYNNRWAADIERHCNGNRCRKQAQLQQEVVERKQVEVGQRE